MVGLLYAIYRERWPSSLSGGLRCMVGLERFTCPNSLSPSFGVFRFSLISLI